MLGAIRRSKEEKAWEAQGPFAGIDEVGVSAIAGPLVACAVILPPGVKIPGVRDSKQVPTHEERSDIAESIKGVATDVSYGWVEPDEVSDLGTVRASVLAMNRAVASLKKVPPLIVSDFHHYSLDLPTGTREIKIIKGDTKIFRIAAASIVAKTFRDTYMKLLALLDSRYGWDTNVGYRSRRHWDAIREHGITKYHRKKYATVWTPAQVAEYRRLKTKESRHGAEGALQRDSHA